MFPGVAVCPTGAEVTHSVLSSVNPIAEGPREMGVHISKGLTDSGCHLISSQEIQNSRQMRGETERPVSPACVSD